MTSVCNRCGVRSCKTSGVAECIQVEGGHFEYLLNEL